jgi:hypothetical protein
MATSKIGILVDGNVGGALARGLTRAGHNDARNWCHNTVERRNS